MGTGAFPNSRTDADSLRARVVSFLFSSLFSRRRTVDADKGERIREEISKTNGERSKSDVSFATRNAFTTGVSLFAWEGNNVYRSSFRSNVQLCNFLVDEDKTPIRVLRNSSIHWEKKF